MGLWSPRGEFCKKHVFYCGLLAKVAQTILAAMVWFVRFNRSSPEVGCRAKGVEDVKGVEGCRAKGAEGNGVEGGEGLPKVSKVSKGLPHWPLGPRGLFFGVPGPPRPQGPGGRQVCPGTKSKNQFEVIIVLNS